MNDMQSSSRRRNSRPAPRQRNDLPAPSRVKIDAEELKGDPEAHVDVESSDDDDILPDLRFIQRSIIEFTKFHSSQNGMIYFMQRKDFPRSKQALLLKKKLLNSFGILTGIVGKKSSLVRVIQRLLTI